MSHAITFPSSGKARAAAKEDAPVKTPTSMTFLAFKAFKNAAFKLRTSGAPNIMPLG